MNRAGLCGVFVVHLIGCGSASTPPKVASDEAASETSAPAKSEGDAKEADAPSDAPKASESKAEESEKPSESLSPEDLGAVLQQLLNDPELDSYLHAEKPGRTPAKMSGPDLPKDLKLVKGTHVVSIVDGPKSPKDAVIVLTKIERDGNIATVAYRYDVENIRGTTRVKSGKNGWELMSSRIVEK